MAGIRRRSALSEATTFVHVTLPVAYLQLDDVFGVYQEESVRIRPFDLGQSARAVSEWRVIRPAHLPGQFRREPIEQAAAAFTCGGRLVRELGVDQLARFVRHLAPKGNDGI
jgi:hypothetical protein